MIKLPKNPLLRTIAPALALALSLSACGQTEETTTSDSVQTPDVKDSSESTGPLAEIQAFIESKAVDTSSANWRLSLARPPQVAFEAGQEIFWDLETSEGNVTIKLMPDVAPMHVSSTIYLTELGFYNGLTFHRIIPGFMAQGGCPKGTGSGNPGYSFDGEFSPSARHDRPGILSMANAGPGTDGSQFFLTFGPTSSLNDKHTVYGAVTEGLETLKALEATGSRTGKTSKTVELISATIRFM